MNESTTSRQVGDTRIQHAADGRFYPQVWEGADWEYLWDARGEDVSFASEAEATVYLWRAARS